MQNMPKIVVSAMGFGRASPDAVDRLKKIAQLDLNTANVRYQEADFLEKLADAEVLIAGTEKISNRVLFEAKNLKLIARVGVGLDNIDLNVAKAHEISIAYTPEAPTQAIPEFTLSLMLNLVKNLHCVDRKMHQGEWYRPMGKMLSSLKVGIVGAGKIGSSLIHLLARAFPGIALYFYDPYVDGDDLAAVKCGLPELFQNCDMISLHLPLNEKTKGLVDAELLKSMKAGSYLVNTSRGGIVDEAALAALLAERHLAGAALDVFETEPYDGPLSILENCLLTAHIGSLTQEVRGLMEQQVAEDVCRFLQGKPLLRPVPGFDYNKRETV